MSIEFNNQDSRLGYLNDKLDDLLEGINASYGEKLFNELVTRLERTINDFNEEISVLTENYCKICSPVVSPGQKLGVGRKKRTLFYVLDNF